eukprot:SAG31_NODE_3479_length_4224_cov_31.581091_1_plen_494_part_00
MPPSKPGHARLGIIAQQIQLQPAAAAAAATQSHPRIAAICTTWWPQSHADVIVWKLIKGCTTDDGYFPPECDVVSLFLDQCDGRFALSEQEALAKLGKGPDDEYPAFTAAGAADSQDNGTAIAEAAGIKIYPSIRQALYNGSDTLDVDGVVLIGEHGDYPADEFGRHMYPRKHLFEQIAGVFAQCGRSVPVFNDKHFSYNIQDGLWMYNRAIELEIPLFAGSSLVVCYRRPFLEHPKGSNIEDALIISGGGPDGYHTLEALQCMVERRAGGESGVAAVTVQKGEQMWSSLDSPGGWSSQLAYAAFAAITSQTIGDLRDAISDSDPCVFVIEYCDGFRAFVLGLGSYKVPRSQDDGQIYGDWGYAALVNGKIEACEFFLQNTGPYAHFSYLVRNVNQFFRTRVPPYNAARTLLTTGIADASLRSVASGCKRIETPMLHVAYESFEDNAPPIRPYNARPTGPSEDLDAPDDNWSQGSSRWKHPLGRVVGKSKLPR